MSKVIAIANQKGGVSKTTTTINLGIGLAKAGKKILLIDADPQGSLTASLGVGEPDEIDINFSTILSKIAVQEDFDKREGIIEQREGIDLMPCNIELSPLEVNMANMMRREYIIKSYIDKIRDDYDYILIDCMPSLGIVTINALTAADSVIIPVQATYLSTKGMEHLFRSIGMVRSLLNPDLDIEGVLVTMVMRNNFTRDIIDKIEDAYGGAIRVFDTRIPHSVRAAESPALGISIFEHNPKGTVAKAYKELVKEVLNDE